MEVVKQGNLLRGHRASNARSSRPAQSISGVCDLGHRHACVRIGSRPAIPTGHHCNGSCLPCPIDVSATPAPIHEPPLHPTSNPLASLLVPVHPSSTTYPTPPPQQATYTARRRSARPPRPCVFCCFPICGFTSSDIEIHHARGLFPGSSGRLHGDGTGGGGNPHQPHRPHRPPGQTSVLLSTYFRLFLPGPD